PQQGSSLTYYLTHSFTNSATNEVCVTVQPKINCQAAFNFPRVAAYAGVFNTNDVCANYLGDTGGSGLPPFSFPVPAGSNLVIVVSTRVNLGCPDYTIEVFGLPCPPPGVGIGVGSWPQVSLAPSAPQTRSRAGREMRVNGRPV